MSRHTPGPWTVERSYREHDGDVHFTIRTVEKLPEHPHSPRYIAWLTGCLREYVPPSGRPKGVFCDACRRWRYDGREVPVEVRDDPETEADAKLMAASPEMFEALDALVHWHDKDGRVDESWWDAARQAIAKARFGAPPTPSRPEDGTP